MQSFFGAVTFIALLLGTPAAMAELRLELQQTSYASDPATAEQANDYSNLLPKFSNEYRFRNTKLTSKVDLNGVVPLTEEGEFHFYSQDLYLQYTTAPKGEKATAFTIGRAQRQWSELDTQWGIGLWQPVFRWDYVRPRQLGLTGVFIESLQPAGKLTFFASPLHLPDQQGAFENQNGEVTSGNRWFRRPVTRLEIQEGVSDIYFVVDKPDTTDVIFNGVYAASFTAGNDNDGVWMRFSVADKPMNQFHLSAQTEDALLLHMQGDPAWPVIHPQVVRHNLTTLEVGYAADDLNRFYLSFTDEKIRRPSVPERWVETVLNDARYTGAGGSVNMGFLGLKRSLLDVGFVQRVKDEGPARESIVVGDIKTSPQRLEFNQLASVGVSHPLYRQRLREISGSFKYMHSFSDDGDWVTAQLNYSPQRNLDWHLGLDVFGAPDDTTGDLSFISTFKNNDRVFGGVSYAY